VEKSFRGNVVWGNVVRGNVVRGNVVRGNVIRGNVVRGIDIVPKICNLATLRRTDLSFLSTFFFLPTYACTYVCMYCRM
jgi:hypothetical protein